MKKILTDVYRLPRDAQKQPSSSSHEFRTINGPLGGTTSGPPPSFKLPKTGSLIKKPSKKK